MDVLGFYDKRDHTLVCVRILDLNVVYSDERFLLALATALGTLSKLISTP
jgi:hypothetical protein